MKRSLGLAVVLTGLVASSCARRDTPSEPEGARRTKQELHELTRARVEAGMLARTDGYVYAVDVALLMIFAAGEGDETMQMCPRKTHTKPTEKIPLELRTKTNRRLRRRFGEAILAESHTRVLSPSCL